MHCKHKYHLNLHIFILSSHNIRVVEMNLQIMSASVSLLAQTKQ